MLSAAIPRNDYVGNGSVNQYTVSFPFTLNADLVVTVTDLTGLEHTLTYNTDYTVAGAGASTGGSITLVNAGQMWLTGANLTSQFQITITRVRTQSQQTDIRNQGDFYPEYHEAAFDDCMMKLQDIQEQVNRCVKQLVGIPTSTFNPTLAAGPIPANAVPMTDPTGKFFLWGSTAIASIPSLNGSATAPQLVTAAGGIVLANIGWMNIAWVKGSGGAQIVTATPSITAGTAVGEILIVFGTDDTNTVTLQDETTQLTGSKLQLNGEVVLGKYDAIKFVWDGTYWVEVSRR